ncbi:MAG: PTS sugar transporter subunit IIA [Candidatus Brocadiia bacterium]
MQLTVKDAAKFLNIPEKTIYRMIKNGEIPACQVLDQFRFNKSELLEWALERKINVNLDSFSQETELGANTPLPTISDALREGGVFYRVGGKDMQSVLQSIVKILNLPESINRELLLKVLLARESLASTGIGGGIAIPHVRNPIIVQSAKPQIALCFPGNPVDFHAIDGKPVSALFVLICPNIRLHLYLLSRLAFILQNESFKEVLKRQGLSNEIFSVLNDIDTNPVKNEESAAE